MPSSSPWIFRALLCASLILAPIAAAAQHGGPGGGGGMPGGGPPRMGGNPGGPGEGSGEPPPRGGPPPGNAPDSVGGISTMRGGLQLGPPGRWWDDKHFARELRLRTDQQRRMDSIFEDNRPSLLKQFQNLEGEQDRMDALTRAKTLDEASIFSEIDRLAEARAALEKANAHYLLQIRREMDPDQIARLEQHR